MKIGVMLRAIDEKQGIGIYSQNVIEALLRIDERNEYVLFYRNPKFLGRYGQHARVKEKLVSAPNKLIWDQVKIPLEARRENVDVLFHTKFTVPFLTGRKTVMTVHGASWFTHPELYPRYDIAYINTVMPLYCRKAKAILSNSELTTKDFIRLLGVPPEKIRTAHLAASPLFKVVDDPQALRDAQDRHALPERFILSVIKYDPRKNFGNLIEAIRLLREKIACKLVVVGIGCEKYIPEYNLEENGLIRDVHFLGWVEQQDLISLYNLADCLFFPSVYEEFGIPVCEAMACGCPLVVSQTGALPEIAGDAGILVDPANPQNMADALHRLWTNSDLRESLAARARRRAQDFTWEKCARITLDVLESLAR